VSEVKFHSTRLNTLSASPARSSPAAAGPPMAIGTPLVDDDAYSSDSLQVSLVPHLYTIDTYPSNTLVKK
jgi:hypothetical protein